MSASVIGITQTIARLAKAAAIAQVAETASAQAVAVEVAETAKNLAPVESGALRDSIEVTGEGVHVGVDYAAPVEYGNPHHPAAQPFVRPAMDEVKDTPAARVTAALVRTV